MTHARELMDEWLLVCQAKRFRSEVVDTYQRYVRESSAMVDDSAGPVDEDAATANVDARRRLFAYNTRLKNVHRQKYKMVLAKRLEELMMT